MNSPQFRHHSSVAVHAQMGCVFDVGVGLHPLEIARTALLFPRLDMVTGSHSRLRNQLARAPRTDANSGCCSTHYLPRVST